MDGDARDARRRRVAVAALVLLLVAVAGIAWWLFQGPTKDEFVEQADTICRERQEDSLALDQPDDLESSGEFVEANRSILDDLLEDIRALDTPEEDRALLDRWFETYERVGEAFDDAATAADEKDQQAFDKAYERATLLSFRLDTVARNYGFSVCGVTPEGAGGE